MNDVRPVDDADDRHLLAQIARGQRDAFEALYARLAGHVFRFVRDLVRDDGIAEELTGDVMVQVWRSAQSYSGRSRVRTWVFGIAHHKAIDALRRRRLPTVELDAAVGVAGGLHQDPQDALLRAYERERIEAALGSLSPEHRAVVELTFVEAFSQAEIAEIAGCPVGTVKTRLFYAKARLREALRAAENAS